LIVFVGKSAARDARARLNAESVRVKIVVNDKVQAADHVAST